MGFLKALGFRKGIDSVSKELYGGFTTFLAMSYILAVNPSIFSKLDMNNGAVFTATVLSAITGTLIMAFYARLPFALAPGMGINAFFVYTVCLGMGYSWQFALTGVLLEGIIFIILTITGLRNLIMDAIPDNIKKAICCGIGLYIAMLGLVSSGFITKGDATILTMGNINQPSVLLFLIGMLLTGLMIIRKVRGALLIGIIATTFLGIPIGVTDFRGVIDLPKSISPILFKFDFENILSIDMVIVILTLLFSDIFDTIGTIVGVCKTTGMVSDEGQNPTIKRAFMSDAVATVLGACFGTSTTTTYVESAAGVLAGGRTGLTSLTTALLFIVSLFFAPLFLSVPAAATAPVLVIVGLMMMCSFKEVDLEDYRVAIPAFVCMIGMPFTYSISDGILIGMIFYVILNACSGHIREIKTAMWILTLLAISKFIFL